MRRCMIKTLSLNVRRYAARLIDLNEYLESFPEVTINDKIGITEINKKLLNSIPNSWYKKSHVQGFDCESISFKKAVKMFERMEISEIIYEGVVTTSYKKTTRAESNCTGLSRNKKGDATSLNTHPVKNGSAGKRRKRYVDFLKSKSKTCMIHRAGNSSDDCKVLENLELSTLWPSLLRTAGVTPCLVLSSTAGPNRHKRGVKSPFLDHYLR